MLARAVFTIGAFSVLLWSHAAHAHGFKVGDLSIDHPWARASIGQVPNGAAYLSITNHGQQADRLVAAQSNAASHVALHTHLMEDGVMKMRPIEAVEIAPGAQINLEPGGHHVMLMGLTAPLEAGESFPLTLVFERAGTVEIEVKISDIAADTPGAGADQGTESHEMQGMDSSADHDHGLAVEVSGEGDAPALRLEAIQTPEAQFTLVLDTQNFRFAKDHVDQPHQAGEGHAHLYVDGEKIARVYGSEYELNDLTPGTHTLRASLNSNDHKAYEVDGHALTSQLAVEVPSGSQTSETTHFFDLQIRGRRVLGSDTIRVTEGETVELQWSSDEATSLHLHGYDIETALHPGVMAVTRFEAEVAGRFPVEAHGFGDHSHDEATLLYLEVHPN